MAKEIRLEEDAQKVEINVGNLNDVLTRMGSVLNDMSKDELNEALDKENAHYRQD